MFTFIKDDFAVFAQEALFAFTSVAPWKILTRSPIAARPGKTLIYILLTVLSLKTRFTSTYVIAIVVNTGSAIFTRLACFTWVKSCVSTIAKPAHWCPRKLVNVKPVAPLDLYTSMPIATASTPMKAHFAVDNLPNSCWM